MLNSTAVPTEGEKDRVRGLVGLVWLIAFSILILLGQANVHAAIELIDPDPKSGTSKAVVVDRCPLAHTAQLLPLNAAGEVVGKNDPSKQIDQVFARLETNLREAQSSLDDLVKLNVYATKTEGVERVHAAIARRFTGAARPAVSFVIGALSHPDALVALDAVAVSRLSGTQKVRRLRVGNSPADSSATAAILPPGPVVYVSGQAERGEMAEATRKTMESLMATLRHLGLNRLHVVQLKAFMRPMSDVAIVKNEIARFSNGEQVPPLAFVEWVGSTPIEIELIASAPELSSQTAETVSYFTPPGMSASPLYSRVARLDSPKTIYVSGLYGENSESGEDQIREIFGSLRGILQKTGSDFQHLVKATYYVANDDASNKLNALRPNYYDPKRPPAASKAMVPGVGIGGKSATLDMIAVPAKK